MLLDRIILALAAASVVLLGVALVYAGVVQHATGISILGGLCFGTGIAAIAEAVLA